MINRLVQQQVDYAGTPHHQGWSDSKAFNFNPKEPGLTRTYLRQQPNNNTSDRPEPWKGIGHELNQD